MMYYRWNGLILLGAIAICVALAVMESDTIVKKPYGPKMCAHLYNRTAGCSPYFYRISDLSCRLTPVKLPKQNSEKRIYGTNATTGKYRSHAENDVRCSQDKTKCTRRYTIHCTPIVSNQPTLPGKGLETRERMRRLLLFAPMQPARQLYTDNNSVVNYPFYQARNIRAIAYIPSHRKLIISDSEPDLLFFMSIDNKTKTIIKSKEVSLAIAIDDKNQLVFMITRSHMCLCIMSTHGKNITALVCPKNLHRTRCSFDGLVADHNRSMIYLLFRFHKIARFTYKGVSKGNVVKSSLLTGVGLHLQGDDLYYQHKTRDDVYCLHKLSLSDQSVKQYKTLIPNCRVLATVDNILYIIPIRFTGDLHVVNTSGMGTVGKVKTGIKQTKKTMSFGAKMCLLP